MMQPLTWIILIPLGFPNSFKIYCGSFETTEKDKLILLVFPHMLSHLAFPSTMVINLGECRENAPVQGRMPWTGNRKDRKRHEKGQTI